MNSNKNGKIIITICREYGSGGRLIGEEVAKRLDIPYYNRNLIDMVAKESGFASGYIDKFEEHVSSPLIWGIPMPRANMAFAGLAVQNYYSNEEKMFEAQSKIIRDIAKKGSCVIVGRCADYLLKDEPGCYRVFIHADKDFRIKRAKEEYGFSKDSEAKHAVKTIDRNRNAYHKKYAGYAWDDCHNYHLTVNSGLLGIERSVDLISEMVFSR